jgi:hypothetical protein
VRVAILQSNYFPWRGYFSIINSVDLFVFHDDLQYTKNDWRNRNRFIRANENPTWLSIPCGTSEKRLICEVKLPNTNWEKEHFQKINDWYSGKINIQKYRPLLEEIYLRNKFTTLSDFNQFWIKFIAQVEFQSKTDFLDSRTLNLTKTKSSRVIEILTEVGASSYLSGPSGRNYLNEDDFRSKGIELEYADYAKLPELNKICQRQGEFSILHDLLEHPNGTSLLGEL